VSLVLSDEHLQLVASVRRFLDERSSSPDVRRTMATADGFDRDVWSVMADQLGLLGLNVPAALGGAGYSFLEQALVFEEAGRSLLCAPYFSNVALATQLLLGLADDPTAAELLQSTVTGSALIAVAMTEDNGRWDVEGIELQASRGADRFLLTGAKNYVIDGNIADLLLVPARAGADLSLFVVEAGAPGLSRTPLETLDLTRKQARVTFTQTPARLIGAEGGAGAALDHMLNVAAVALAMEQVGGAQRCLDMAVEYAKVRVQFGRPIGSFQAVKHKCADMLIAVEKARSAAYHASWTVDHAADELPVAASMAKALCSELFCEVAAQNIQVHGGIGYTWENDAHLYYRRAYSDAVLFGDAAYHRELLARRLGF
jgi:alkylation response protein AidB-like acyl-CoA dehydrogenase